MNVCGVVRRGVVIAAVLVAVAQSAAVARAGAAAADGTLETAEGLIRKVFGPPRDANMILAVLRNARDPALAPLFEEVARRSATPEVRVYAMVAATVLAKDPSRLDLPLLLEADPQLAAPSLAQLIDTKSISDEQLETVLKTSRQAVQRVMAAGELEQRKALQDKTALAKLAGDSNDVVRYYAAVSLLASADGGAQALGVKTLQELAAKPNLRAPQIEQLMLLRIRKNNLVAGAPWVETLARRQDGPAQVRDTAIAVLLSLHKAAGPEVLAEQLRTADSTIEQIQLGMIAVEFAGVLQKSQLAPLLASKTGLVRHLGKVAEARLDGHDGTSEVLGLIEEQQPIVQNWALGFADSAPADLRLAILQTLAGQAQVVDGKRDSDFTRGALAAQGIAEDNTPAGRRVLGQLLQAESAGVVEAALAGMMRSAMPDASSLVLPVWPEVCTRAHFEQAANSAALLLAREGHKEALPWLAGMVGGGTVENDGFRALAGWYYAKLSGQNAALLKAVAAPPR